MSHDVAARLAALSQDHREGRLTVSAYRSLRAPLLDMLVTAERPAVAEETDSSTTTRPRYRTPTGDGTSAAGAAAASGMAAGPGASGDPLGLLAEGDSLAEASALARTNLRAGPAASRSARLWPIVIGAVLFVIVVAGWMAWPMREAALPTAEAAPSAKTGSRPTSLARDRALTPMPPPLTSEPKRKNSAPSRSSFANAATATTAAAASTSASDAASCEPQARSANTPNAPATPCRDRLSPTELGPRMLLLAGPATSGVVFAISARPVSQAQFRAFCQRTSRPYPRQPWTEDDDPVVNVTWNEARDYLAWLSSTTGKRYRLATETEWLYFVGQGKLDPRWRNGNVREWLQDTASDPVSDTDAGTADAVDVANATLDSTPGGEHQRLVRGVSYADTSTDLLSARRSRDASMRDALTGFRALREIH